MKIGILTYFRAINYGAYLQAYALSHRLNQEDDIEAELIDFHMPAEDRYYQQQLEWRKNFPNTLYDRRRYRVFQDALKYQILSESSLCGSDIEEFNSFVSGKYDIIIAGSDEIWKLDGFRGFPTPYFLPGDTGCIKVSYAASGLTRHTMLNEEDLRFAKECFNDFSYLGVREIKSVKELESFAVDKGKVHLNYDPCFVYDFAPDPQRGRRLLKEYFHLAGERKVIAVMYTERSKDAPVLEKYIKRNFGDTYDFISLYVRNTKFQNNPSVTPFDWIDLIAAADGMISMFYHGICFSILAGTPFYAVEKRAASKEESKLYDLLNRIDLLNNFSYGFDDAIKNGGLYNFMNSVAIGEKLDVSFVQEKARKEFDTFLSVLRSLVQQEERDMQEPL